MELLIESSWYHVTWKVPDFFQLPSQSGYTLKSPKFLFADDSYCLQLNLNGVDSSGDTDSISFLLVRLTSLTKKDVLFKLGHRICRKGNESDLFLCSGAFSQRVGFRILRFFLEEDKFEIVPDGTLTLLCSLHLGEQSNGGNPQSEEAENSIGEEEHEGLPGQSEFFKSCWRSTKMELAIESPCQYITLKVPHFFELPTEIGYSLESHEFRFGDDNYCLRLYPNGYRDQDTAYIYCRLVKLTSNFPERNVSYKIGHRLRYRNGKEYDTYCSLTPFKKRCCLLRSEIEGNRDFYVPDGTFTLLCSMILNEQRSVGTQQFEESETSAEKEQKGLPGVTKLQTDFRQLLHNRQESDACLVVSGKEFHIHRCVLRARSAIFEAMFGHELAEKESGRVVIDDIDPESFGDFLEYLYTGCVEAGLSDDNAFGMFLAADKYDVPTLRSECVAHMRRTLSVDSFCDVVTLALRHHETDLLQQAIQFFKNNLQSIIVTVKWQQFVIDNGTSANELFIKAFVPGKQ